MDSYQEFKQQLKQKEQKLAKANKQTEKLDLASKDINEILDSLKPTKLNKNNMIISSEEIKAIKDYTKDVKDTNKTIRSVNELNIAVTEFENSAIKLQKENNSLRYQIEQKDNVIGDLKTELSAKDKIIIQLKNEKRRTKSGCFIFVQ